MNSGVKQISREMPISNSPLDISKQVNRRRTFAIISHPDAGKTTITEKLLLYGGAIDTAGSVRSRRAQQHATSDWMELEKQRGISISSTVIQFEYKNWCINLLDTPGHHDFGEDTYRTLTAADSAVMLIDAAKGLEPQTRKLFEVCRLRKIPIFTFINKMDRPSLDPIDLLDEIESELGISTHAINWPIGTGNQFKGIIDRSTKQAHLFDRTPGGRTVAEVKKYDLDSPELINSVGKSAYDEVAEELEMIEGAGHPLDIEEVRNGTQTPVYFGSAMNNFGVQNFLDSFVELATPPGSFQAKEEVISPTDEDFTGFVFKLQANMDPKHRDRIAFVRICSGVFVRQMNVRNSRTGRRINLNQPRKLFASEREMIDEAYPGDIIGLSNPGVFSIGDTISSGKKVEFPDIPIFTPELFAFLRNKEPNKYKQFHKGIEALQEEGAIQIYWMTERETRSPVLAAVGPLQFDVAQFRLKNEYGVDSTLEPIEFKEILRVENGWDVLKEVTDRNGVTFASDRNDQPILLFRTRWHRERFEELNPSVLLKRIDQVSMDNLTKE